LDSFLSEVLESILSITLWRDGECVEIENKNTQWSDDDVKRQSILETTFYPLPEFTYFVVQQAIILRHFGFYPFLLHISSMHEGLGSCLSNFLISVSKSQIHFESLYCLCVLSRRRNIGIEEAFFVSVSNNGCEAGGLYSSDVDEHRLNYKRSRHWSVGSMILSEKELVVTDGMVCVDVAR
jgi:hypothetical protein